MRTRSSVAPHFAVGCALTAWLICDFHRIGERAADAEIRSIAVVGGAAAGWALGAAVSALGSERSAKWTLGALLFALPILGTVVGLLAVSPLYSWGGRVMNEAATIGFTGSLVAVVPAALTVRAARRAARARPGSLVHEVDHRAPWAVVLATAALAAPIAVLGAPEHHPYGLWQDGALTAALAAISALGTLSIAWSDLRVARQAAAIARAAVELRAHHTDVADDTAVERIDLGLGEQELSRVRAPGAAYRSALAVEALVKGDPLLSHAALARARRTSAVLAGLAMLGLGASLLLLA
jgi:hypothetical protein